jgi:hypothetical protein
MNSIDVIGEPIKIENIKVAQFDFPNQMDWYTAVNSSLALGEGWRLPTKKELNLIYKNKEIIGGFTRLDYWCSTEGDNLELAWFQNFFKGKNVTFKKFNCRVRAVKSIIE